MRQREFDGIALLASQIGGFRCSAAEDKTHGSSQIQARGKQRLRDIPVIVMTASFDYVQMIFNTLIKA